MRTCTTPVRTLSTATEDKPVPQNIDDQCPGNQEEKPCKNLDLQGIISRQRITKRVQKQPDRMIRKRIVKITLVLFIPVIRYHGSVIKYE